MSKNMPEEIYYKSRRFLVISSAVLFMILFAELTPVISSSGKTSLEIFSFKLNIGRADFLPHAFAAIALYGLWQFLMGWFVQSEAVQKFNFNKWDFYVTTGLCAATFLTYVERYWGVPLLFIIMALAVFFAAFIQRQIQKNQIIHASIGPAHLANATLLRRNFLLYPAILIIVSLFLLHYIVEYKDFLISAASYLKFLLMPAATAALLALLSRGTSYFQDETEKQNWQILNAVTETKTWHLMFNLQRQAQKVISFEADGTIGQNPNENESAWRVKDGFLEILNSKGQVFSRFKYGENGWFNHTNDEDTLSLRDQWICPEIIVNKVTS